MDLDSMLTCSHDELNYFNYDNRPIRPMDQEALNEVLARLPILIDDDEATITVDPFASLKTRRQPILAYSTRRKNPSGIHTNQSVLNVNSSLDTPRNNNRKLVSGTTPVTMSSTRKLNKYRGYHQELMELKEDKQILEQEKTNFQLECIQLTKLHENEFEILKDEHQQVMNKLITEHQLECEELKRSIVHQEQIITKTNVELTKLRDDHSVILLEKETLNKIVAEYKSIQEQVEEKLSDYEMMIKKLREEISQMKENHQPKRDTNRSNLNNTRTILKENTVDRMRPGHVGSQTSKDSTRSKMNSKVVVVKHLNKDELSKTPSLSINNNINKSSSSALTVKSSLIKSKLKSNIMGDVETKSISSVTSLDKPTTLVSTRSKPKLNLMK